MAKEDLVYKYNMTYSVLLKLPIILVFKFNLLSNEKSTLDCVFDKHQKTNGLVLFFFKHWVRNGFKS